MAQNVVVGERRRKASLVESFAMERIWNRREKRMAQELRGIVPVLITPFDEQGELDEGSLRREVEYCIEQGAHGLAMKRCLFLVRSQPISGRPS